MLVVCIATAGIYMRVYLDGPVGQVILIEEEGQSAPDPGEPGSVWKGGTRADGGEKPIAPPRKDAGGIDNHEGDEAMWLAMCQVNSAIYPDVQTVIHFLFPLQTIETTQNMPKHGRLSPALYPCRKWSASRVRGRSPWSSKWCCQIELTCRARTSTTLPWASTLTCSFRKSGSLQAR